MFIKLQARFNYRFEKEREHGGISITRKASGARMDVTCYCDAPIASPLRAHVFNKGTKADAHKKNVPDFSGLFPEE